MYITNIIIEEIANSISTVKTILPIFFFCFPISSYFLTILCLKKVITTTSIIEKNNDIPSTTSDGNVSFINAAIAMMIIYH